MESSLKVIELSNEQLTILDPPYRLFGYAFIAGSIFCLAIIIFVTIKVKPWKMYYFFGYIIPLVFFAVGLCVANLESKIIFSRKGNTVLSNSNFLGFQFSDDPILLSAVKRANIQYVNNLKRIELILTDGSTFKLTSATDRNGYELVVDAINQFIVH